MDLKRLNERLNYYFTSNSELISSVKQNNQFKLIEQARNKLDELHESFKECSETSLTILNLLNNNLNPILYKIGDELIEQHKELDSINRKSIIELSTKNLNALNDQRNKLSRLIDSMISIENQLKTNSKYTKIVEDKSNLYKQLGKGLESQLEELFSNDDLLMNLMNKYQVNLKIKKAFLISLIPVIDEFSKQRTKFLDDWKSQDLRELFDRTLNAFEEEFKKCFKIYYKAFCQSQQNDLDKIAKDKSTSGFKECLNEMKTKLLSKFEVIEKEHSEQVKNQISMLITEFEQKIATTIQQACDSIGQECKQTIDITKQYIPTQPKINQDLINDTMAFKNFFGQMYSKQTTSLGQKQAAIDELKSKVKDYLLKVKEQISNEMDAVKTDNLKMTKVKSKMG